MEVFIIKYDRPVRNLINRSFLKSALYYLVKSLVFWAPSANADYEGILDSIDYWYLEIDCVTGTAQREIGFDSLNKPIEYAPYNNNFGFWTDTEVTFNESQGEKIDYFHFKNLWLYGTGEDD